MPTDPDADGALLKRAVEGDDQAFSTLVHRHEDRIFALAYRITGDRADALDATQDAFIAAFRQAHSFRGEASFGTWLYRIGINACRDVLRKRARAPLPTDQLEAAHLHSSVGTVDEQVALRLDLGRALAALPEQYREAVVMHDLGAVPYQEIAALTGTSIGTVKSRISRGRRQLAELLEQASGSPTSKDV